ncbi:MAG: FG-GAP-like repeat-containing protein, partial [Psychromonas sp.]|nr:FG-GAP-like repeat-containing protein [Psychromonas sp.]
NDGDLDLYLANSNAGNQCFVNNGDGTFTESAAFLGIADPTSSFSCGWADFDNDGDLDLYVANASSGVDKLYRNEGATFTDVAASVGTNDTRHSNSTTWADFNNDGFLDLYLSNNGSENRLYMSNAGNSNHWLELKLVGITVNRSAIGARVRIVADGSSQIREVQGGSGHNGQNSLPVEFGLGAITTVDSIIVNWPGGPVDIHTNIAADQIISVTEGQPIVSVELSNFATPVGYVLAQNYPNPFNPSTTIEYSLPERTDVKLSVINIVGEEVTELVNQTMDAGNHRVEFNAANLPSGVYFYRLQAGNPSTGSGQSFITSKKMILLK